MSAEVETPLRRIPGPVDTCEFCGEPIVWAITVAGPNGPGGKAQPFNHFEHVDARVALIPGHGSRPVARALHKDEDVVTPIEYRGMPHVATCRGRIGGHL